MTLQHFTEAYGKLNHNQKQAVDTLDGPVLVVAGPGTGKTQLLSLRAVNILARTDAQPQNILCLTFTEAGQAAMRERITQFIGGEAHHMSIMTFHSFAAEIINRFPQYFMTSDRHRTADELTQRELVQSILDELPHKHWLRVAHDGSYLYLRELVSFISDAKRSGFSPDELREIAQHNEAFCDFVAPLLQDLFVEKITKTTLTRAEPVLAALESYHDKTLSLPHFHPLSEIITLALRRALEEAQTLGGKTTPLTAFKNKYCEKTDAGLALKDAARSHKLLDLAEGYEKYLEQLRQRELSDFDDLILRVTQALEHFPTLRSELQEQYHYIMVDEFQDTNAAQMRIVWHLTNDEVHEGRPNLLVVGDDDQGIYRFQGAELSNILDFTKTYRDVEIITLTDNYRSASPILELARSVITSLDDRLENREAVIDKTLTPHYETDGPLVELHGYETSLDELGDVAHAVAQYRMSHPADTIAVIAQNNAQLVALSHQLTPHEVPLSYTRRDNILENELIVQLTTVAGIVDALARREFDFVDEKLAIMLTHPAWGVSHEELWQLSLAAHRQRLYWLEVMLERPGRLKDIGEWLVVQSHQAINEPLERMLDQLLGTQATMYESDEPFDENAIFTSPLRQYFFASEKFDQHPLSYLSHLRTLQVLRDSIVQYRGGNERLKLEDFVRYEQAARQHGIVLTSQQAITTGDNPITLVTAHSAKGFEYDHVFIIGLTDESWGAARRANPSRLSLPRNVVIGNDTSYDELVRLLYVGLTRAKTTLRLSYHQRHGAQARRLVAPLAAANMSEVQHGALGITQQTQHHEIDWKRRATMNIQEPSRQAILQPIVDAHRLSATDINLFLDLEYGGPQELLLKKILCFPETPTLHTAYGIAIHAALSHAHKHLAATGKRRPVEDVLNDFELQLGQCPLTDTEYASLSARGTQSLATYLGRWYEDFTPEMKSEIGFAHEQVEAEGVPITGKIDLLTLDPKTRTIRLVDYKTSTPKTTWHGKTDRDRRVLAGYRRQLMFYKLLVENSRTFRGYTVTGAAIHFIEPLANGEAAPPLSMEFDETELRDFVVLLRMIWRRIHALQFEAPGVEGHDTKAVAQFIKDLINQE